MSDLTDRCEQQAKMILCHGFKATHNLLLDCAAEIKRLTEKLSATEANERVLSDENKRRSTDESKIELLEAQLKWMEKINRKLSEEPMFAFWLDISERADLIEELESEVERLRELEEVVKCIYHYGQWRVEDDADIRRQIDLWQHVKDLLREEALGGE